MTAKELMNMVRRSALEFVRYDRANLTDDAFFGKQGKTNYHSVVHFVHEYEDNLGKKGEAYDVYMIFNEKKIKHFSNENEAMEFTQKNFGKTFPKEIYTVSYADKEKFYRREKNLAILCED